MAIPIFRCKFVVALLVILISGLGQTTSSNTKCFLDFPISTLQKHIKGARHLPVCVVYRLADSCTSLERKVSQVWKNEDLIQNCSAWQIGSFIVDKYVRPPVPIPSEADIPTLRCFLGSSLYFDYDQKPTLKRISSWLYDLFLRHKDQVKEATVDLIEEYHMKYDLTLLAFPSLKTHHEVEEIICQARDKASGQIGVLLVHPHSPHIKILQKKYDVRKFPTVLFLHKQGKNIGLQKTPKRLETVEITQNNIDLQLFLRNLQTLDLNQINFEEVVLDVSKHHVPILVCFYGWWAPDVLPYLSAYDRLIKEFKTLDVPIRFGLFELTTASQNVIGQFVKPTLAKKFPLMILFQTQWNKTEVTSIKQIPIPVVRPTLSSIQEVFHKNELTFMSNQGNILDYKPWGQVSEKEFTALIEGPYGTCCTIHSHNATDNYPRPWPKLQRVKHEKKSTKKKRPIDSWHLRYGSEAIDSKLPDLGGLPLVTATTWHEAIEKSHAPHHPFISENKWQGEKTKVALVVFIMADCHNCERNMKTFEDLQTAVRFIDGGAIYVVNCTHDPGICKENKVSGFPTLSAFRGLGWLGDDHCLPLTQRQKFVRLDYHGVLRVKPIMEWFSKVTDEAVSNERFQDLDHDNMEENVRLVASLIPKRSRFLPYTSKRGDFFFPYECFRLACEHLFGQAPCYVQYSNNIPEREFLNEDQDMVVSEISMHRSDGVSANLMKMGKPLVDLLEAESDANVHHFHKPHKYDLKPKQKCEDDHRSCSDYVIEFTRDHGRLPITRMSSALFHTQSSFIFDDNMAVLIALTHQENMTDNEHFYKTLLGVSHQLYNNVVTISVDVELYPAWAGRFVPVNYAVNITDETDVPLYIYPRLCMVFWQYHRQAAFYPPLDVEVSRDKPFKFIKKEIIKFAQKFIADPGSLLVETEHF